MSELRGTDAGEARPARGALIRKELRETFRDRRTALTLIAMPVLLYPLLGLVGQRVLFNYAATAGASSEVRLGFDEAATAGELEAMMQEAERLLARDPQAPEVEPLQFQRLEREAGSPSLEALVASGQIDAAVRLDDPGPPPRFRLLIRQGSRFGERAAEAIESRLGALRDEATAILLRNAGEKPWPRLVSIEPIDAEEDEAGAPSALALIPLILLLMTATGAIYPAIDLTAGERERGTLETLAATPLAPLRVLFAKYVAVACVALATGLINLTAMLATLYALGLESVFFGDAGPRLVALALMACLMILFVAFFSAVVLSVASFARSFKEAQAYLIPLMIAALTPGAASLMPDLQLTPALAAVPVLNLVLLARDVLAGSVQPGPAAAALLATALYAVAALAIAAQAFTRYSMEFGDADWRSLLGVRGGDRPGVEAAAAATALVLAAYLYLSGLPSRGPDALMWKLLANAAVTAVVFVLLPLAFTTWGGWPATSTFALRRPTWFAVAAAIVLGFSAWPAAFEITASVSQDRLPELEQTYKLVKEQLLATPLALRIALLAVIPAVCEEFFFRGLLLGSLRRSLGNSASIAASALLFGVFHVLSPGALLAVRMAPSTYMGLILGVVRLRTGSLIPGIILHATHNAILLSLDDLSPWLQRLGLSSATDAKHLPWTWLAVSAAGFCLGAWLLTLARPVADDAENADPEPANSLS